MLFSVIVPIYNIEKYIKRCVDSVLGQTFADYELILVDDGSPDACPAICDEYAKEDARIKVVHKPNGGLVSARQAGIEIARGDYIFNLDGDDALCPDALESAQKIIAQTGAEMVCFSYRDSINDRLSEVNEDLLPEGFYDREQIKTHIFPNVLFNGDMQHLFFFSWGKAIKRELALKHQMQVDPVIRLGEDVICTVPCYLDAQSVYLSKKAIYLYTIRNDSMSKDFKTEQVTQIENVILGLRKLQVHKPEDFEEQIARYSCFMCFMFLAAAAEGNYFNAAKKLKALMENSLHSEEIKKAQFRNITVKSRIAIFLMKRQCMILAFYFLYVCKVIKHIGKGGKA